MKTYLIVGFAVLCGIPTACFGLSNPGTPVGKAPDYPVQISAKATRIGADGWQTIEVTLKMETDWSVYANPVGNEDFKANETSLTIATKSPLLKSQIEYPKGEVIADKVVGDFKLYNGTVRLIAKIQRTNGGDTAVDITVYVQPINFRVGMCLLPKKLTVQVQ